ncbi:MAG: hypothetical protein ACKO6N_04325 [Myxococcota bacterium]
MSTALAIEAAASDYDLNSVPVLEVSQPFWRSTVVLLHEFFELDSSLIELARVSFARALRAQPLQQVDVVNQLDQLKEQRQQQRQRLERLVSVELSAEPVTGRRRLTLLPLMVKGLSPVLRRRPFLAGLALLGLTLLSQVLLAELSRQAVRAQCKFLADVLMEMLLTSMRIEPQLRILVRQHAQGTLAQRLLASSLINRLTVGCETLLEAHIRAQKQGLEQTLHTDQAAMLLAFEARRSQLRGFVQKPYTGLASVMSMR